MLRGLRTLIENQIAKARAEGKLQGLEGEGKPLPPRDATVDAGLEAGYKIMAEAGVIPEEFKLKKELDAARKLYAGAKSEEERKALMSRIADLEMRYNIAADARRKFMT